jgi:hypothetical protein
MVPFQRDSAFVGRQDILAKICRKHKQIGLYGHSRVALVRLGGVWLVFQYIILREVVLISLVESLRLPSSTRTELGSQPIPCRYSGCTRVMRIDLSNSRDITTKVELPGHDHPKADILRLLYNWLCDETNGRWLRIVDNADDNVFFPPDTDLVTLQASLLKEQRR